MKKILSVFLILSVMCLGSPAFAGNITSTGMNQGDLYNLLNNLSTSALTRSFTPAGVGIASQATTILTANTLYYSIAGNLYSKTAVTHAVYGSGSSTKQQAASTYCLYLFSLNSSGTIIVTKGSEVSTDTAILPALPSGYAPFGAVKVQTGATTFTYGATALSNSLVTDTYYNLSTMDSGPSRVGMTGW